jgi:hypothetical protein
LIAARLGHKYRSDILPWLALKALISGIAAGHLISAVFGGKAPPEATAEAYHQWLAGWFSEDAAKLMQFCRWLGAAGFAGPRPEKGLAAGDAIG